jgi:hypothetical protein
MKTNAAQSTPMVGVLYAVKVAQPQKKAMQKQPPACSNRNLAKKHRFSDRNVLGRNFSTSQRFQIR